MKRETDKKFIVFFDFDNTITSIDVIDNMLERFSGDDNWKDLEKRWQREEIGSLECLKGQVEGIRVDKDTLDSYLSTIKIDPYFNKLLQFFGSRGIPVLIVSDNFDYMLKEIYEPRKNVWYFRKFLSHYGRSHSEPGKVRRELVMAKDEAALIDTIKKWYGI